MRLCYRVYFLTSCTPRSPLLSRSYQLSSELGRREELFNEKAAVFRRMGHTVEDSVVLDDDMFDMTFERIDTLEPQMEALRAQRTARVAEKKQLLDAMWTRMRTPPGAARTLSEAVHVRARYVSLGTAKQPGREDAPASPRCAEGRFTRDGQRCERVRLGIGPPHTMQTECCIRGHLLSWGEEYREMRRFVRVPHKLHHSR